MPEVVKKVLLTKYALLFISCVHGLGLIIYICIGIILPNGGSRSMSYGVSS